MSNVRHQGTYVPPPPPPAPPAAPSPNSAAPTKAGQPAIHSPASAGGSPPGSQVSHQGSFTSGASAQHTQPKIFSSLQQQPAPAAGGAGRAGAPAYRPSMPEAGGVSGASGGSKPAATDTKPTTMGSTPAPAPASKNSPTVGHDIGKIIQGLADVGDGAQTARTNFANADASLQKGQYVDALHSTYKGMNGVSTAMQGALDAGSTIANRAGATDLGKHMSDLSSNLGNFQKIANGIALPLDSANSFLKTYNSPSASDADKRTAAGDFVNSVMKNGGRGVEAGAKVAGVDDAFVKNLHSTLNNYGTFGTSMAGLAQNGQDFRTAANNGDLTGMWKAGSTALQNGVIAGQSFASQVGGQLKAAGFTEASNAMDSFGKTLGILRPGADALVATNNLLPTDGG